MWGPLAHLYNWQGDNFGQTIQDKTKVLLGTSWETYLGRLWEHDENMMGTHLTEGKKTKNPSLPHLSPFPIYPQEKNWTVCECWAFPLVAWNFSFQNYLSPSFTWANTHTKELGYLSICHLSNSPNLFIGWGASQVQFCWSCLPRQGYRV